MADLNLAQSRRIYPGASTFLTEEELKFLSDGDTTISGIQLTSASGIQVICDLGARYSLSAVDYFSASSGVEDVNIDARQNNNDTWNIIPTTYTQGAYRASGFQGSDKYQFIRVTHSVISGVSTVLELQVTSSGIPSVFPSSNEAVNVAAGIETTNSEKISIRNAGTTPRVYYFAIEGGSDFGSIVQIATQEQGPYYSIGTAGIFQPTDFIFSEGQFQNTTIQGNSVAISSGLSGIYYTPVFNIGSLKSPRIYWEATVSGTTAVDAPLLDDVATVEVRLSRTSPTDAGWVSGKISTDSLWDVNTGSLPYVPYANYQILEPDGRTYLQMKVTMTSDIDGESPLLLRIGVEQGISKTVPGNTSDFVYIRTVADKHIPGRTAGLLVWYLEDRNI